MKEKLKILAPCGILGYGFPVESFQNGMDDQPDAIIVDAGSTDAGPHKLGAGVAIVSRTAYKKDLSRLIQGALSHHIPLIIGSAGGSGAIKHTKWTIDVINEVLAENNYSAKVSVIWSDITKEVIHDSLDKNEIVPLGTNVPQLLHEVVDETISIVAQMGVEPIMDALKENPDILICGRAYDPAPFAAFGIANGFDEALSYHLGKILECGALCAVPGTTKDCIMGVLEKDSFYVYPTNKERKCTVTTVAAHTFYEKDHPYLLHGPGMLLNLEECDFIQIDDRTVRVQNSKMNKTETYFIKLEGARQIAYRTFVIAGIRDPLLLENLDQIEEEVKKTVQEYYCEISPELYNISFVNYGYNGVMGELETDKSVPKEVGVLMEVTAKTQELASAICSSLRSSFMHYGYTGRKSTSGNLAFPFSPSDIDFGPVYEFSIYHLMKVKNGQSMFPITNYEVNNGKID